MSLLNYYTMLALLANGNLNHKNHNVDSDSQIKMPTAKELGNLKISCKKPNRFVKKSKHKRK